MLEQISGSKELKANHNFPIYLVQKFLVGTNIRKQRIESKSQPLEELIGTLEGWNKYQEAKN